MARILTVLSVPLSSLALILVAAALLLPQLVLQLPPQSALSEVTLEEPLRIYAADGSPMAQFGVERRMPIAFEQTPPLLVAAFLAAEDSRFFEHPGVDVRGLLRAAASYLRTGTPAQGGSTITMQLARNLYLSPHKTIRRKLTEILIALRLERTLSKEEIFAGYLNRVFFGHRAYGVEAAARVYYGKPLADLQLPQWAMLAGIVQAPSRNNPVTDPEQALQRRNYVLQRMRALGSIDETAYRTAIASEDTAHITPIPITAHADYVAEMARLQVLELFGQAAYTQGLRVYTTVDPGLQGAADASVRNALRNYDVRHGYSGPERHVDLLSPRASEDDLDRILAEAPVLPELQPAVVLSVTKGSAQLYLGGGVQAALPLERAAQAARPYRSPDTRGAPPTSLASVLSPGDVVRLYDDPDQGRRLAAYPRAAAALVALDPSDGAIRALVGGYAFSASAFNRATDAKRQPGSAFKPFLYAAALSHGYSSASILNDSAIAIEDAGGGVWEPRNFGGNTLGEVRLHKALAHSLNLASVNLLRELGLDTALSFVPRFGIGEDALPPNLTGALGSGTVTPLLMARGYAVFANGGYRVDPYVINRIEDAHGRVLFQANPHTVPEDSAVLQAHQRNPAARVIDPDVAYQMHVMLSNVITNGTGKRALALDRDDIAGKTGTTSHTRDAWFCGYHPHLVAIAWMGTDDFKSLGSQEVGGRAALALWSDFMRVALRDRAHATMQPPPGMLTVFVNEQTEELTDQSDPQAVRVVVPQAYASLLDTLPMSSSASDEAALELSTGPYLEEPEAPRPPQRLIDRLF
jgi:penicillin-binding protein 1A